MAVARRSLAAGFARVGAPGPAPAAEVAVPRIAARHCQRRWDTSPYRRTHRLTWSNVHRARWPIGGSMAWQPRFSVERPLPPDVLLPSVLGLPVRTSGAAPSEGPTSAQPAGAAPEGARAVTDAAASVQLRQCLQAYLNLGSGDALALIQRSRVTVNGRVQRMDRWLKPGDAVAVNGHCLTELAGLTFFAHKPAGCTLTEEDPLRRPTYTSLLPDASLLARPAGRLDVNASGLLVLTNRRDLAETVANGSFLTATFVVTLREPLTRTQLRELRSPAFFGEADAPLAVDEGLDSFTKEPLLRLILPTGTPKRVRLALTALGVPKGDVLAICCTALGSLTLEDLGLDDPGTVCSAAEADIARLLTEANPESLPDESTQGLEPGG